MSFEEPRLDSRPNATIVLLVAFVEIYREQDLKRAGVVLEKKKENRTRGQEDAWDRLMVVNNETLYIDASCLRCFFIA